MLARQLHCSLLLELPDKDLERRFWEDDHTLKTYTYWDAYISTNMIISNLIMTKTLFKALADPSALRFTWHMHVNVLLNLVACTANLLLIFRHRALYKRNRHKCVVGQRLLRLFMMFVAVYQSSESLQAGSARKGAEGQAACRSCVAAAAAATPVLKTAVLNLTRPLFVGPVITMAVQNVVSWLLAVTAGLGLLWVGVTWAVPQLPLMPCQTCADSGNCQAIECEGALCSSPGHWTAVVLYGQMLFVLIGHLAVTRFV